jgi:DNA-binding NtrC family response regulator
MVLGDIFSSTQSLPFCEAKLKILFLENHPHFPKAVIQSFLAHCDVTVVPNIAEAKSLLNHDTFDVALIDYDLDDGKGDEFIKHIKDMRLELPMVACSSHDFGNHAMLAMGANAICSKLNFKDIALVIHSVLSAK